MAGRFCLQNFHELVGICHQRCRHAGNDKGIARRFHHGIEGGVDAAIGEHSTQPHVLADTDRAEWTGNVSNDSEPRNALSSASAALTCASRSRAASAAVANRARTVGS